MCSEKQYLKWLQMELSWLCTDDPFQIAIYRVLYYNIDVIYRLDE